MNELIELLFEDVPAKQFNDFLSNLITGCEITSSYFTGDEIDRQYHADFNYFDLLNAEPDVSKALSLRLGKLIFGPVEIESPLLQALFYDSVFDVSISFLSSDAHTKENQVMVDLMHAVSEVAKKFHIRSFMCGHEPATDSETRFFTNDIIGPIVM